MFGRGNRDRSQSDNPAIETVESTSSFRVKDGILINELEQLEITGGQLVPSFDESLVNFPAPNLEKEYLSSSIINTEDSICQLDFMGNCKNPGAIPQCKHSKYNEPKDSKYLKDLFDAKENEVQEGGLIWSASIVPDDFDVNFEQTQKLKMCHKNHYDAKNKCIKPRRGHLLVKSSEFFGSLVKIDNNDDEDDDTVEQDFELYKRSSRWIFSGVLNGWPALKCLEVLKIEFRRKLMPNWKTHWDSNKNQNDVEPSFPTHNGISEVKATLRMAPYSMHGWSRKSPGYVFWFEKQREVPRLTFGTDIVKLFESERLMQKTSPKCVKVHMISHRYAMAAGVEEQFRDRLTYHSLAFLEWDHGEYCTIAELAYLGGIGGYNGRANWIEDKMENNNSLYRSLPPEMIHPWKSNLSEIRVYDVNVKNLDEQLEFMEKNVGYRFLDVQVTLSHPVRLTFCSKENVAQYIINYIRRGKTYSEIRRNCQTFAADFCAFLAGKKDVQPYHPINQQAYRNQAHYFLYEPTMYGVP